MQTYTFSFYYVLALMEILAFPMLALDCLDVISTCCVSFQTAAVVSAYQAGLVEGRYQERCDRYAEQIKCLTESLEYANKELRRISGLPPSPSDSDNGMHAVERPGDFSFTQ